jgi:hypothetical protein
MIIQLFVSGTPASLRFSTNLSPEWAGCSERKPIAA